MECSESGWEEFGCFLCYFKMIFRPTAGQRGTKTLETRLVLGTTEHLIFEFRGRGLGVWTISSEEYISALLLAIVLFYI